MTTSRVVLYLASAAGVGLLVRTLVRGPIPVGLAIPALVLYTAYAIVGACVPQLRMYVNGYWRGPRDRAQVALTFDDGPHPVHTIRILDLLDQARVKATFFMVGHKVLLHPETAAEVARRGHQIGIHGFLHDPFLVLRSPQLLIDDLKRAQQAVLDATGKHTTLFRPPVGVTSPRLDEAIRRLGLTAVAWSVRGLDGVVGRSPLRVVRRVAKQARPGSIVLLHDAHVNNEAEPASITALPKILDALSAKQLRLVRMDEMVNRGPASDLGGGTASGS